MRSRKQFNVMASSPDGLQYYCRPCNSAGFQRHLEKRGHEWALWRAAKARAKQFSLPFDLEIDDIIIPTDCPVFPWITLARGEGAVTDSSPTLDKIVPERGYVRGNVCVISMRANRLKSNATLGEAAAIHQYIHQHTGGAP